MIDVLGTEESKRLLSEQHRGRLGCSQDGQPYIVPIHYLYVDDYIYVHSLPGRKIDVLRANPRACVQVDDITNPYVWRSVIAYGNYEELTDPAEREQALERLLRTMPNLTPVESMMTQDLRQPIVFRLRIDEITGRCER